MICILIVARRESRVHLLMILIEYIDLEVFQGQGEIFVTGLDQKEIGQGEKKVFLHGGMLMEGNMCRKAQRVVVIMLEKVKQLQKKLVMQGSDREGEMQSHHHGQKILEVSKF